MNKLIALIAISLMTGAATAHSDFYRHHHRQHWRPQFILPPPPQPCVIWVPTNRIVCNPYGQCAREMMPINRCYRRYG